VRLVLLARDYDYDASCEWTEEYRPDVAEMAVLRYYETFDILAMLDVANKPDNISKVPSAPSRDGCKWCPFATPGKPNTWAGCPGDRTADRIAANALAGIAA